MSLNLVLSDFNDDGPTMMLSRFKTGITISAEIRTSDWIRFEDTDIVANVVEIIHKWERPMSLIAPVSTVRCVVNKHLTDEEWDKLRELGFKDLPKV